jgi:hypothetical protein
VSTLTQLLLQNIIMLYFIITHCCQFLTVLSLQIYVWEKQHI